MQGTRSTSTVGPFKLGGVIGTGVLDAGVGEGGRLSVTGAVEGGVSDWVVLPSDMTRGEGREQWRRKR